MKKHMFFAMVLCGFTSMNYAADNSLNDEFYMMNNNLRQKKTFMAYLPSTIASGVVGAFTGGLTRYLEREFKIEQSREFIIYLMAMWWIEHKVRHKVINSLEEDFVESDVPYKKNLMSFSAWASSWISYFNM